MIRGFFTTFVLLSPSGFTELVHPRHEVQLAIWDVASEAESVNLDILINYNDYKGYIHGHLALHCMKLVLDAHRERSVLSLVKVGFLEEHLYCITGVITNMQP
jgi:hypothetical protein